MAKSTSKQLRKQASQWGEKLTTQVESARDKAAPVLADARDKAAPVLADARDKAAPVIADARDKTAPVVDTAKDKFSSDVAPKLAAAVAAASEATEDVRGEARKRGLATAAALRGDVEAPKKKHRLRRFLVFTGLAAIAALIAKSLSDRQSGSAWQSSYQPTPAGSESASTEPTEDSASAAGDTTPASADDTAGAAGTDAPGTLPSAALSDPTPAATPAEAASGVAGDDVGAAGPDEAVSDATDAPHPATTPDEPAEEIKVRKKS